MKHQEDAYKHVYKELGKYFSNYIVTIDSKTDGGSLQWSNHSRKPEKSKLLLDAFEKHVLTCFYSGYEIGHQHEEVSDLLATLSEHFDHAMIVYESEGNVYGVCNETLPVALGMIAISKLYLTKEKKT